MTAPLLNGVACFKNPHWLMAMSADKGENLETYAGNGDIAIWVKIFKGDKKNNQANKHTNTMKWAPHIIKEILSYLVLSFHNMVHRLIWKFGSSVDSNRWCADLSKLF